MTSNMSRKSEAELEARIEHLRSLPVDEIRALWRQTFKSPELLDEYFLRRILGGTTSTKAS